MSSRAQIERALKRAVARDNKRMPRMKVSGKGVLNLQRLVNKGDKRG